jgi:signal recognition particle receptor subunit beta
MDYYNQVLELVQTYAGLPLGSLVGLDKQTCYYISHALLFFTAALAFTQILALLSGPAIRAKPADKGAAFTDIAPGAPKKKKVRQNLLLICGPNNSGKTALFYHLLTKEVRNTVSSIDINETPQNAMMDVKIPQSEDIKRLHVVDIPGHFHYREQLHQTLDSQPKCILLLLDSKDKGRFPDVADLLYDILNNLTILSSRVPIVVVCNKQDLQFAKKAAIVEGEIEKEIEEVRKVRRAQRAEDEKQRYIDTIKKRFSFEEFRQLTGVDVKFVEGSVAREELGEVYKVINNTF